MTNKSSQYCESEIALSGALCSRCSDVIICNTPLTILWQTVTLETIFNYLQQISADFNDTRT